MQTLVLLVVVFGVYPRKIDNQCGSQLRSK